jgi:predicted FMN-binding regulatory protein PaiB
MRTRLALPLLLLAYLIAGALYATSAPLLEVSDEVRHYAMVEHLAQGNELPIQDALK